MVSLLGFANRDVSSHRGDAHVQGAMNIKFLPERLTVSKPGDELSEMSEFFSCSRTQPVGTHDSLSCESQTGLNFGGLQTG